MVLNIVAAMAWPWFGPISNDSTHFEDTYSQVVSADERTVSVEFGISLDRVNWLGNIVAVVYLPSAVLIPAVVSRYGIRRCVRSPNPSPCFHANCVAQCDIGAISLLLAAWIRYAGTSKALSSTAAYALLIIGQVLS